MSATDNTQVVCNKINDEVVRLLNTDSFREWADNTTLRAGDLVVFNNSFLIREGLNRASKNAKYLCAIAGQTGKPQLPVLVARPGGVNSQFKRISASNVASTQTEELYSGVQYELSHLGMMVRALIGRIGEDEPASIVLEGLKDWYTLKYEPKQSSVVEISNGTISINRVDDLDVVWNALSSGLSAGEYKDTDKLPETFERKFTELREMACRPVDVNDTGSEVPSILGEVTKHLDIQIKGYGRALKNHLANANDGESFNELLRIAYNFADGTQELMNLAIGLCDMKPVIFWLTICDQLLLAEQFGKLPFAIIGKGKPSLSQYRSIIAGARNRAFHDTFSFGQPFRARLTGEAFKAAELRLFRNYTSKAPVLDYEDRGLVALLEGFTRPAEKPVPMGFWETNLKVMMAVAEVARSLHRGLLLST
jgi:hypothetical protein